MQVSFFTRQLLAVSIVAVMGAGAAVIADSSPGAAGSTPASATPASATPASATPAPAPSTAAKPNPPATMPANMISEDYHNLQQSVANLIDDALDARGFDSFASSFTRSDHDRLVAMLSDDGPWKAAAVQFRKDWRARYGNDFNVDHSKEAILNELRVTAAPQRSAQRAAQAVSPTAPVAGNSENNGSGDKASGEKASGDKAHSPAAPAASSPAGSAQLDRAILDQISNDRVIVVLPSYSLVHAEETNLAVQPGRDEARDVNTTRGGHTSLRMLRAGGSWRAILPVNVDAKTILKELTREITDVDQAKATWPKSENDAYRVVADHVLHAILRAGIAQPPVKKQGGAPAR